MMVVRQPFVADTNILLTAVDDRRPKHAAALSWVRDEPRGLLVISPQIIREFLGVATRPVDANGLGLSRIAALNNIDTLMRRGRTVEDTFAVSSVLRDLFRDGRFGGKQIHDANIVATALVYHVPQIVTDNVSDFEAFTDLIDIVPLT